MPTRRVAVEQAKHLLDDDGEIELRFLHGRPFYAGLRPWLTGTLMLGIGVVLVLLTMALGG